MYYRYDSINAEKKNLYLQKLAEYERIKSQKTTTEEKHHILNNSYQGNSAPSYGANNLNQMVANFSNKIVEAPQKEVLAQTHTKHLSGFKAYESSPNKNKYGTSLHNKNNLREAFVMSEILKRKY